MQTKTEARQTCNISKANQQSIKIYTPGNSTVRTSIFFLRSDNSFPPSISSKSPYCVFSFTFQFLPLMILTVSLPIWEGCVLAKGRAGDWATRGRAGELATTFEAAGTVVGTGAMVWKLLAEGKERKYMLSWAMELIWNYATLRVLACWHHLKGGTVTSLHGIMFAAPCGIVCFEMDCM